MFDAAVVHVTLSGALHFEIDAQYFICGRFYTAYFPCALRLCAKDMPRARHATRTRPSDEEHASSTMLLLFVLLPLMVRLPSQFSMKLL